MKTRIEIRDIFRIYVIISFIFELLFILGGLVCLVCGIHVKEFSWFVPLCKSVLVMVLLQLILLLPSLTM